MQWVKGQCLWVRCRQDGSGVVLAVRRKLGNAVVRNRLKRRLRSICRDMGPNSSNLVVFPQPLAVHAPFTLLQEELKDLVSRL